MLRIVHRDGAAAAARIHRSWSRCAGVFGPTATNSQRRYSNLLEERDASLTSPALGVAMPSGDAVSALTAALRVIRTVGGLRHAGDMSADPLGPQPLARGVIYRTVGASPAAGHPGRDGGRLAAETDGAAAVRSVSGPSGSASEASAAATACEADTTALLELQLQSLVGPQAAADLRLHTALVKAVTEDTVKPGVLLAAVQEAYRRCRRAARSLWSVLSFTSISLDDSDRDKLSKEQLHVLAALSCSTAAGWMQLAAVTSAVTPVLLSAGSVAGPAAQAASQLYERKVAFLREAAQTQVAHSAFPSPAAAAPGTDSAAEVAQDVFHLTQAADVKSGDGAAGASRQGTASGSHSANASHHLSFEIPGPLADLSVSLDFGPDAYLVGQALLERCADVATGSAGMRWRDYFEARYTLRGAKSLAMTALPAASSWLQKNKVFDGKANVLDETTEAELTAAIKHYGSLRAAAAAAAAAGAASTGTGSLTSESPFKAALERASSTANIIGGSARDLRQLHPLARQLQARRVLALHGSRADAEAGLTPPVHIEMEAYGPLLRVGWIADRTDSSSEAVESSHLSASETATGMPARGRAQHFVPAQHVAALACAFGAMAELRLASSTVPTLLEEVGASPIPETHAEDVAACLVPLVAELIALRRASKAAACHIMAPLAQQKPSASATGKLTAAQVGAVRAVLLDAAVESAKGRKPRSAVDDRDASAAVKMFRRSQDLMVVLAGAIADVDSDNKTQRRMLLPSSESDVASSGPHAATVSKGEIATALRVVAAGAGAVVLQQLARQLATSAGVKVRAIAAAADAAAAQPEWPAELVQLPSFAGHTTVREQDSVPSRSLRAVPVAMML